MSQPQRMSSTDSSDAIRKRVCKACDRCRLKKSKCDGSSPCLRCKADNAICVFGERKKSHDKVYPKGYVEMLEQQQGQLISALQAMYHQLRNQQVWNGPELSEVTGHPLTHDILSALNLLEPRHDGSGEMEEFEDDVEKLQSRLIAGGAGYMQRRGSFSSESEHSQPGQARTSTPKISTPKAATFKENFNFSTSPSPLVQSPVPRQRLSYPTPQHSPLGQNFPMAPPEPQLYPNDWTISNPNSIMVAKYAPQVPQIQQDLDDPDCLAEMNQWAESLGPYEIGDSSYPILASSFNGMNAVQDHCGAMELMDVDYQNFLQMAN